MRRSIHFPICLHQRGLDKVHPADMRGQRRGLCKEGRWGLLGLSKARQKNLGPAANPECHPNLCIQGITIISCLPRTAGE